MSEFTARSSVREVLDRLGEPGRHLLYQHGFDVGDGFVDVLSQYQRLEDAHRAGRLRDLPALLERLNHA